MTERPKVEILLGDYNAMALCVQRLMQEADMQMVLPAEPARRYVPVNF